MRNTEANQFTYPEALKLLFILFLYGILCLNPAAEEALIIKETP